MKTDLFWIDVIGVLFLLLINALFVATEQAYLKLRFSHFNQDLLDQLKLQRPFLRRLLDHPATTVGALRMVITACIVGYVWLLAPLLLVTFTGLNGVLAHVMAYFIALIVQAIFGELVPRGLGLQYPLPTMVLGALPTRVAGILLTPLMRPLNFFSGGLLRALGADEHSTVDVLDAEEQIDLMESIPGDNSTHYVAQKILKNTLTLKELDVSDILLPRNQIQYVDLFDSISDNLQLARMTGHTRFPLCEGDLDNCIGLIHIKDIFRSGLEAKDLDLRKFRREILRLREDMPVEDALESLMRQKMHMALIVDEFGGTQGVLTLERILEVIVGEIQDEFDIEEANICEVGNGDVSVLGLTPLHEVEEYFDKEFDTEEVSTFGGLVTSELGHIPEEGHQMVLDDLNVRVTEVDEKRVIKMLVRPLDGGSGEEAADVPETKDAD